MKIIGSVKEDLAVEKRIAITPESTKKFTDLNISVFLEKNYGEHLTRRAARPRAIAEPGAQEWHQPGRAFTPDRAKPGVSAAVCNAWQPAPPG